MGGVDVSGNGRSDNAVFFPGAPFFNPGSRPPAGAYIIGILPEFKGVVGKIIISHVAVPGGFTDVGGTVITSGYGVQAGVFR